MAEKTSGRTRKSSSSKKITSSNPANVTPINQGSLPPSATNTETNETKTRPTEFVLVEQIRYRAYELFVERGRIDGFDQEDWARAEAEILAKFQREKSA